MARVIYAGTFDPAFARNRRLRVLLERGGHDVATCQVDVWGGDRYEIPNQRKLKVLMRALLAYPRLVARFLRTPRADLVLVGYPGWVDMIVLAPLARLRRMPVVFDPFISVYDTVVEDRKLVSPRSMLGRMCKLLDRLSLRRARRVLADTPSHADYYAELAHIPRDRIGVVWLGAQDDVFGPRPDVAVQPRRVLFHGTFIGLQGIETIIRAAKLLEPDGIELRVVGSGQEQTTVDRLMTELQPANVEMVGRVPLEQVPAEIAAATVCLGIFGTSNKAHRVVPNKVFECAAVGRPVVTGDTPAIRSAFSDHELAMVPTGDPDALAAEIRRLLADNEAREKLALAAHERYVASFATEPLTRLLDSELRAALTPARLASESPTPGDGPDAPDATRSRP
jgi:glycosyltransferase involved in cell wall biosynthesis